ncbi:MULTISPECIES: type I 3-dehydroquinate dehydratase [Halorubrum]|uniref:3-dehydroquinate dehydratase n=1 Tax=Halorubrum sodomense TaxID=35743 RepID=A0A1I6G6M8_HALSD|nr:MULTISPECIES: type I 3-dehydroquinate dehydratase [Halorubrum]TKX53084.1 type I 3-dehydroquinate dehydratase [Halorubrum sp. SP3]TKX68168.1 type I 3-dehydroquinate dehydratase [Halorubrum sp. SP9]SFR37839.1 3-dehydroquinate dehydratase [Halorubrum sodomense]
MFEEFVLTASTADLSEESAAREHADAVEFRMDLASDPLDQLASYDGELPLVVTNRASWEGGEAEGLGRYDALSDAIGRESVAAVDVELAALRGTHPEPAEASHATALRDAAREAGVAVVASVHDFESTPEPAALVDLLADAASEGDVGKLATTATAPADALAMIEATHEATAAGHRVATMCMGEPGRHTRAVTPLYGSRIGYAPVDPANATAPGQYPLATLRELIDGLREGGADA